MACLVGAAADAAAGDPRTCLGPTAPEPIQCGEIVSCTLAAPGDIKLYTFSVGDGAAVWIATAPTAGSPIEPAWTLLDAILAPVPGCATTFGGAAACGPLAAGDYAILVSDYADNAVGGYGVVIQPASATKGGTLGSCTSDTTCREAGTGTLGGPPDVGAHGFLAAAGEGVVIQVAATASPIEPSWQLYAPSGQAVDGCGTSFGGARNCPSLPETGRYTVVVTDFGLNQAGDYAISFSRTATTAPLAGLDCALPIACGTYRADQLQTAAAGNSYHFTASAGESAYINTAPLAGSPIEPSWQLYDPDGQPVQACGTTFGGGVNCPALSSSGRYTLVVSDYGLNAAGGYGVTLQFTSEHGCCAASISGGTSVQREFAGVGDVGTFAFQGVEGSGVVLNTAPLAGVVLEPQWQLYGPSGEPVAGCGTTFGGSDTCTLPSSGTHLVVVNDFGGNQAGGYNVSLQGFTATPGMCTSGATLSSALPNHGGNEGTVTIAIRGFDLSQPEAVLLRSPETTLPANSLSLNGRAINASVDLRGAAPGLYDVVARIGGRELLLPSAFEIETGGRDELWASIVAREQLRPGLPHHIRVTYGNRGTIDRYDVLLRVRLPHDTDVAVPENAPSVPGIDWNQVAVAFQDGDETVVPIWIYRIGAGETGEIEVVATPRPLAWLPGASFPVLADLRVAESAFSQTGDLTQIGQSGVVQAIRATLHSRILAAGGTISSEEQFTETVNEALGDFVRDALFGPFGAFVGIAFGIAGIALVEAGFIPLGLLATVLGLATGLSLFDDLTKLYTTVVDAAFNSTIVQSVDPNEKVGPVGCGPERRIVGGQSLTYRIFFENAPQATAAARTVELIDEIDPTRFDVTSLALGPINVAGSVFAPPHASQSFETLLDLRPGTEMLVRVTAALDEPSHTLRWMFESIDPTTGLPPEDPVAGFLPPNLVSPQGEGHVTFTVNPLATLPSGSTLENVASIIFDGVPLETPTTSNLLVAADPCPAPGTTSTTSSTTTTSTTIQLTTTSTSVATTTSTTGSSTSTTTTTAPTTTVTTTTSPTTTTAPTSTSTTTITVSTSTTSPVLTTTSTTSTTIVTHPVDSSTTTTAPPPTSTSTTPPMSSTTTTGVSATTPTTTTIPCSRNPRCALEATRSAACADDRVPSAIRKKLEQGALLAEASLHATGKRATRLRKKAVRVLKAGGKAAKAAARGKKPKLSADCAAAIGAAVAGELPGLRAP